MKNRCHICGKIVEQTKKRKNAICIKKEKQLENMFKKCMITYEEIKPYIEKKLITEREHPDDANIKIVYD